MKSKIKAVLFDMDGTLVRMGEKEFTENYLGRLCKIICPLGYDRDALIKALWAGVASMVKNDGTCLNSVRFWDTFAGLLGDGIREQEEVFARFYSEGDFRLTKEITAPNPEARPLLDYLREKGVRTVLATNPLFPECAQNVRLDWAGLTTDDFEYITHYDNCSYCKPSTEYFRTVLEHMGLNADECLMIGNSVNEDILPAEKAGIKTFLVEGYVSGDAALAPRKGSFAQMAEFIKNEIEV